MKKVIFLAVFGHSKAPGGLGGLKLDEIDAANSFLMLPMARNGSTWPFIRPVKNP